LPPFDVLDRNIIPSLHILVDKPIQEVMEAQHENVRKLLGDLESLNHSAREAGVAEDMAVPLTAPPDEVANVIRDMVTKSRPRSMSQKPVVFVPSVKPVELPHARVEEVVTEEPEVVAVPSAPPPLPEGMERRAEGSGHEVILQV
jgi:hypothetical protein